MATDQQKEMAALLNGSESLDSDLDEDIIDDEDVLDDEELAEDDSVEIEEEEDDLDDVEEEEDRDDEDDDEDEDFDDDEDDEITSLRQRLEELEAQQRMNALLGDDDGDDSAADGAEDLTVDEIDFLGDKTPTEVLRDPAEFNKLLNAVYAKGIEQALRAVPRVAESTVTRQAQMVNAVQGFYQENPELASYKPYVVKVMRQAMSQNPSTPLPQILEAVATKVRGDLKLQKRAKTTERKRTVDAASKGGSRKKKAKFAGGSRRGRKRSSGKQKLTAEQKEIADMLAATEL